MPNDVNSEAAILVLNLVKNTVTPEVTPEVDPSDRLRSDQAENWTLCHLYITNSKL